MIPHKLVMKNFLSHVSSSINFDKFNAALILGSYNNSTEESNGAGKSAILEAIRWVLFDKSRHKRKDGVVKRDTSACTVQFEFEVDGIRYRVTRKRNKVLGESEVTLEQWQDSDFKVIECDTNTATDNKIVKIVGFNHEVFTNSVYFKQGDISMFTRSTPSKRKDVLKALLKLEQWDSYQKKAKQHAGKLSTQIEERRKNMLKIEEIEDSIFQHEESVKALREAIKQHNEEYFNLNQSLLSKKYELDSIPDDADKQLRALQKEFNAAKKRAKDIRDTIDKNDQIIKKANAGIASYTEKLKMLKASIKAKKDIDLEKARAGLNKGRTKANVMKEKISHLQKDISGGQCDHCLRPFSDNDIDDIKALRKEKLIELKTDYKTLTEKIKSSETKFSQLEAIYNEGTDSEIKKGRVDTKLVTLKNDLNNHMAESSRLSDELNVINERNFKQEIDDLREKYSRQHIEALQYEIAELEPKVQSIKTAIDNSNVELGSKVSARAALEQSLEEQKHLQKQLNSLSEQHRIYDKLKSLFGKDGVQSIIIENVIDELENYTNNTLAKICNEPTSIAIKMQKQSDSGSWTETFDIEVHISNRQDEFESLSGGEQFRISLALRLALSKILSKRMGGEVQFLLLDEVSSSLDEKGLVMFADIVKHLSTEMKVMIITHDNRLKDHFEDIIMVEKDSSGSRAHI